MIVLVNDVKAYRRELTGLVREGDVVVEIGPHRGAATRMVLRKEPELVVTVDYGEDAAEAMRELEREHDNLVHVEGDARDYETLENVLSVTEGGCDVLAIDMGGGAFPDTVFKVFYTWGVTLRPRDSIVRNAGLCEFVQKVTLIDGVRVRADSGFLSDASPPGIPGRIKEKLEEFDMWRDRSLRED
ncbi:MAG: SAM-dependent methyltransferase [Methanopyri archaeon]|nr:SAM-dependent methyltransferase [Methanopyri archaeon]